jgi:hypothetical protein
MNGEIPAFQNPTITVRGPNGEFYTVPKEGLNNALESGFTLPSNDEIQYEINRRKEAESNLGAIRALAEETASGLSFGLSRQLENKLGITTPEEQKLVKEAHPIPAGIGTATSIIAPLLATFGGSSLFQAAGTAAKAGAAATTAAATEATVGGASAVARMLNPAVAATKIGEAVQGAVAPQAAKIVAGIAETSPRLAQGISKGLAGASGLAAEGALYTLGNQISEDALGDPEALGENLLSNLGWGTLISGGAGALFHGGAGLLAKRGEKLIPTAADSLEAINKPIATFEDAVKNANFDDPIQKEAIVGGLRNLKPHVAQIEQAAETLGIPVFPGQVSANDGVQKLWQILVESASPFGQAEKQSVLDSLKVINDRVSSIAKTGSTLSKAEIGARLAERFYQKADEAIDEYTKIYQLLGGSEKVAAVNERSVQQIARNILRIPEIRGGALPEFGQALQGRVLNMKNLEDVAIQIKLLNGDARKFNRAGDVNGERIANYLKGKLERLYETTVKRQFSAKESKLVMAEYKAARSKFAQTAQMYGRLATVMGKKNIGSPINFLRLLRNENAFNPDTLVDKLFTKNNTGFLKFLAKDFPEEFALIRDYHKGQFAEFVDGNLNVNKFIKQMEALEPEVRNALFSKEEQAIVNASKTYLDAFPTPINPSKTALALGWMEFLNNPISATYQTARDLALKLGFGGVDLSAKDAPRNVTLSKIKTYSDKTASTISGAAKGIFKAGEKGAKATVTKEVIRALPRAISRGVPQTLDEKEYKKVIDKVNQVVSDPEETHSMLSKSTEALAAYAPGTAGALQRKMVTTAMFLQSKAPVAQNYRVLSGEYNPSQSEIAKFNRYYSVVKTPAMVLGKIPSGNVLPEEMETLKTVYPELLAQMQGAIMEELADHLANGKQLPYQTKIGLSKFLEQDLVNSMTQQNIAMNQMTFKAPSGQQQQGLKPTAGGLAKLNVSENMRTGYKKLAYGTES